ncbi:MAG: hypothetical protein ACK53Y_04355, partial [bacterium]
MEVKRNETIQPIPTWDHIPNTTAARKPIPFQQYPSIPPTSLYTSPFTVYGGALTASDATVRYSRPTPTLHTKSQPAQPLAICHANCKPAHHMASGSPKHYRHETQPIQQSLPPTASKLTSRRKTQRRKHRYERQLRLKEQSQLQQIIYKADKKCVRHYGFTSSPAASKTMNFKQAISKLSTNHNNNLQPTNLSYHNLCTTEKPPPGTRDLLGLNLKYCLASATTDKDINKT